MAEGSAPVTLVPTTPIESLMQAVRASTAAAARRRRMDHPGGREGLPASTRTIGPLYEQFLMFARHGPARYSVGPRAQGVRNGRLRHVLPSSGDDVRASDSLERAGAERHRRAT